MNELLVQVQPRVENNQILMNFGITLIKKAKQHDPKKRRKGGTSLDTGYEITVAKMKTKTKSVAKLFMLVKKGTKNLKSIRA